MTINSLPADLAAFVDAAVSTGKYDSAEAVLVAGLQLLRERQQRDEEIQRQLQEGLDALKRGDYITLENDEQIDQYMEKTLREAEERLAEKRRRA